MISKLDIDYLYLICNINLNVRQIEPASSRGDYMTKKAFLAMVCAMALVFLCAASAQAQTTYMTPPTGVTPYIGMVGLWNPAPGIIRAMKVTRVVDEVNGIINIMCWSQPGDHLAGAPMAGQPYPFVPYFGAEMPGMIPTATPVGTPTSDVWYSIWSVGYSSTPPALKMYKTNVGGGKWISVNIPRYSVDSTPGWAQLTCPAGIGNGVC